MSTQQSNEKALSRQAEECYLEQTLAVVRDNLENYGREVNRMQNDIDEMLAHYHDNDVEVYTILTNTVTLHEHMKRALMRNEKALNKPYFGRIIFHDELLDKEESIYIGKGGISKDTTHWMVVDWRAPVANAYYENGLGKCSYTAPNDTQIEIDLEHKRTYEIEGGRLLDYFDSEVIANDELLTKYLAKNKQAVLSEIVATIQKEQNEIIRKSPYHNMIVQGVAGSGKTTVAMHRISYILYNYEERFKPDDFYIVGSNRILLNYITGVLPDLDVYGIRQMTMEQLFIRLLYEDWDDKKYSIKSVDKKKLQHGRDGNGAKVQNVEIIKGSSLWFRELEKFCSSLERQCISTESVYLNPKQFVEGIKDGKTGVYDETARSPETPSTLVSLLDGDVIERYIVQNPSVSIQSKINMLNTRLRGKIKEEFLGKGISYTEAERKAILKAYRGYFGGRVWKRSIFDLYSDFLTRQNKKGYNIEIPDTEFDVYDLAALAYLYKRVKETEVISEAHHIVIDEAQDFGMMAYLVLHFCIYRCTYTIMGDVSQNIHFGYGLDDWEELRQLFLTDDMDSFSVLKKSYRNTVEISDFATNILHHGQFSVYPVEPIIRHGNPVRVQQAANREEMIRAAADICKRWQGKNMKSEHGAKKGEIFEEGVKAETIAVVCRNQAEAAVIAKELSEYIDVIESNPEKAVFESGIMVLPVEYTKGLEFDAVLIVNPTREDYPVDDGQAKLLYVAATRALHELCVLHTGNLTGLIVDPIKSDTQYGKESASVSVQAEEQSLAARAWRKKDRIIADITINDRSVINKPNVEEVSATQKQKFVKPHVHDKYSTQEETDKKKESSHAVNDPNIILSTKNNINENTHSQKSSILKKDSKSGPSQESKIQFGDMPATERLCPPGHGKIDLAVRWVVKQQDGLYLHSRYGILRLSPIGSAIVRITFARGNQIIDRIHEGIAVHSTDRRWMYKESGAAVDLMTDELFLQADKSTGAIRYMTRDKKLLLAERSKECRQLETGTNGKMRTWLYLDWQKNENIYAMGTADVNGINIRKSARCISHGNGVKELPFLLSDQGYGIVVAADSPVISCDIPAYGSYIHAENGDQLDFYFITGRRWTTIIDAYAYLCGKL